MRDLIHRALAREMVCGCSKRAVRALSQRRILRGMELDSLIGNVVRGSDGRRPRVVVVKLPRDERSVALCTCLHIDDTGRPEIRPAKFLFTRPLQLRRCSGSLRQTRTFNRSFSSVLAAVTRPRIGY